MNNRSVSGSGYLRRHESALLLVGAIEPEVQPWLRMAGYEYRVATGAKAALKALAEAPAQLILVAGERTRGDGASVCEALRDDARLGEAWLLAISDREDSKTAVAALHAGADDYLPRPFTRTELLARTRAGVRAAQQRSDDTLLRALMVNVPGAIYRSAWHADHTLALISDEIERISGYPPENFIASAKRTIMSIVHPDDRERVLEEVARAEQDDGAFVVEYRIVRADGVVRWVLDRGQLVRGPGGRRWMDGAIFDITDRREAEEALRRREVEAAPLGGAARLARPHRRGRRRRAAQDRARPPRRRPAAARDARARRAGGKRARRTRARVGGPVPRAPRRGALAGLGGAARARPRHPPRGADRPRPRARDRDARRACAGPGRGGRAPGRAPVARGRGDGVLHRLRGAHQRRQVRPRDPRDGPPRER